MTQEFALERESVLSRGFNTLLQVLFRHRRFDGAMSEVQDREVMVRGHAVVVVLYDPDREVITLIEQFRVAARLAGESGWDVEAVSGGISPGESPEECAIREAMEEAGCRVESLIPMGELIPLPSCVVERVHFFCALVDSRGLGGLHGVAEEGEDIRVVQMTLTEARTRLAAGGFRYLATAYVVQWLLLNQDQCPRRTPGPFLTEDS